jgi:hypothetical protein
MTAVMRGSFDTVMVTVALLVDVEAPSSMLLGDEGGGHGLAAENTQAAPTRES